MMGSASLAPVDPHTFEPALELVTTGRLIARRSEMLDEVGPGFDVEHDVDGGVGSRILEVWSEREQADWDRLIGVASTDG